MLIFEFWTSQSIPSGGFGITSTTTITPGETYMVTVTRTGDDFYLYVNGQEEDSELAGGYVAAADSIDTWIGKFGGGHWDGMIDDVSIYTDVLTPDEIAQMYTAGKASHYQQTILDTDGVVGYWRLSQSNSDLNPPDARYIDEVGVNNLYVTNESPDNDPDGAIKGDNDDATALIAANSEFIGVDSPTGLPTGSDPWTMEAWVKFTSSQSTGSLIGFGSSG